MLPCLRPENEPVLLPTAIVNIKHPQGEWQRTRALIDTGSEVNVITKVAAKRTGLDIDRHYTSAILGVGGTTTSRIVGKTLALIQQREEDSTIRVMFMIVEKTTALLPPRKLPRFHWPHLESLDLADPHYDVPAETDMILGATLFARILKGRIVAPSGGSPIALQTTLGWLVLGSCRPMHLRRVSFHPSTIDNREKSLRLHHTSPSTETTVFHGTTLVAPPRVCRLSDAKPSTPHSLPNSDASEDSLRRLVEEAFDGGFDLHEKPELTLEEAQAESIYAANVERDPEGRYRVALPLKATPADLGDSWRIAYRRLMSLESRLRRNPDLRTSYNAFMQDYLDAGHMELVTPKSGLTDTPYYLPHHCVRRVDDPPGKIRVVFNASQKSSNGKSLNDALLPGPKLQTDISQVLILFREYRYIFTADIRQMFRQIEHPQQYRDYLRILWRFSESEPVREFRLTTVTYGTSPAPYLAIRTLLQLASDNQETFPDAADVLRRRTYVDDLHDGADTLPLARSRRDQLIACLHDGGFKLRKWTANHFSLLSDIPQEHRLSKPLSLDQDSTTVKVLGLGWDGISDSFCYTIKPLPPAVTKRELLSQMARVFDPMGWLSPVSVAKKIMFREVCQSRIAWDDPLPPSVATKWDRLCSELSLLNDLTIPRQLPPMRCRTSLVGFSDASQQAYAAVWYLHASHGEGRCTTHLIAAKSRVAPLKQVSLPRLELCAAQLLARILRRIVEPLGVTEKVNILAFSDSAVTLNWLTAVPPHTWKVFVGNRVAETLSVIPASNWYHVRTKDNPADCASRGMLPGEAVRHPLWWQGPAWMRYPTTHWPLSRCRDLSNDPTVLEEQRNLPAAYTTTSLPLYDVLEERYSSYSRLRNVVAYCRRFLFNKCHRLARRSSALTAHELREAELCLVRRAQRLGLRDEIVDALRDRPRLQLVRSLGAFVDQDGVLRVGGRLQNAELAHDYRHPALLPAKHPLTKLLIEHAHVGNLHAGATSTHAYLRQRFWIVDGKNVVRRQLQGCNRCFTLKPKPFEPPMGPLPRARTSGLAAFHSTGVDYTGAFHITAASVRGAKKMLCYLAIFVCMATKAVHIEVVSDLSTPAFIAAYRRFCARRGHPHAVFSDNATNFEGARNELHRLATLISSTDHQTAITTAASENGTHWSFIPPRAPHFGGLWEAAVKSTKRHIHAVIGQQTLTYEQLSTLAVQVEAVLNSRPISATPTDANDVSFLTPGHFLIFRPLTAPPDEPNISGKSACTSRWRLVQQMIQSFWKRWRKEYLHQLQTKQKWTTPSAPAVPGTVVLLMDENCLPTQWSIGRITAVFPGVDGVVRVAEVATPQGSYRRPVRKLCPLPTQ